MRSAWRGLLVVSVAAALGCDSTPAATDAARECGVNPCILADVADEDRGAVDAATDTGGDTTRPPEDAAGDAVGDTFTADVAGDTAPSDVTGDTAPADVAGDTATSDVLSEAGVDAAADVVADVAADTGVDVAADTGVAVADAAMEAGGGDAATDAPRIGMTTDATGTVVADFRLEDQNPSSATYHMIISPRGLRSRITAWYFASAT